MDIKNSNATTAIVQPGTEAMAMAIIEIIILIRSVIGKKSYRQWLYAELCFDARNGLIETLRSTMAIASRSSHPSPPILVGSHHDNGPAWSSNTAHTFTVDKHEAPF